MYTSYFGLQRKPFELSPNSSILFLGRSHKEALAILKKGVVSEQGFLLFTGGVGTGKTTLINVLANTFETPGYLCVISNPTLDIDDFFYYFAAQLGLLFDGNRAKFLCLFASLLEECAKGGKRVLLIVDEAHALPTDLLEELRLLVNMADEARDVLSVFLVGQPELLDRLKEEQLQPLKERIRVRFHLSELSDVETGQYVLFRLSRAGGGNRSLFTEKALEMIYSATGGNPRLINVLCDNALLTAYAQDQLEVGHQLIREVVEQLRIDGDDAYTLPPAKKKIGPLLMWGLIIVSIEVVAGFIAYYQGWLTPLLQWGRGLISPG